MNGYASHMRTTLIFLFACTTAALTPCAGKTLEGDRTDEPMDARIVDVSGDSASRVQVHLFSRYDGR
jgi:hypothetical protein